MNRFLFGYIWVFLISIQVYSQQALIKGSVFDATTNEPIPFVNVSIISTNISIQTDADGQFQFDGLLPLGQQFLLLEKEGYSSKRYPIVVSEGQVLDLSGMSMEYNSSENKDLFLISISDDILNSEDDGLTDNVSGLLQSSRDAFLTAAAYDFSATFFRPRGLDNANGKLLINGIEMNKQFNGRPQWANWGGLNDLQRNQVFTMGMAANDYTFGDLAGTNNIVMRASQYREGGRVSFASANRTYIGRVMGSYSSGVSKDGWSYAVIASRRFGNEGFVDGTLYDSNSFMASVEKQLNARHSLNFLGIYAQNRRGRNTAITQEVFELRNNEYNPLWGMQNGSIRNARVREINEPILMLNHYWNINSKVNINSNVAYQFGKMGDTRIDNGGTRLVNFNGQSAYLGGARNPDPSYYQNLPSYFLRDPNPTAIDYEQAYLAQDSFKSGGQLDWNSIYQANLSTREQGGNSIYAIQEDRMDDKQLSFNSILDADLSERIRLNANINYRHIHSENYALLQDLLGGTGFLDVDFFAEETDPNSIDGLLESIAQSDRRNPNRLVQEGDRYKYNYTIDATILGAFAQAQFNLNRFNFYVAGNVSQTSYQRNGLFENGNFPGEGSSGSFGKSDPLNFTNYGIKGGANYRLTGKHILDLNASHFTKAPTIRNSFSNARQNNQTVVELTSESIESVDVSYIYRSPIVKARLTGFYTKFDRGTDIGFYFTEDLAGLGFGSGDAFVQEIVTNIGKRHLGAEFGLEAQLTTTIKLKAAASIGQYTYTNNPNLYLTNDDFDGSLSFGDGTSKLKSLHVAGGPERAYQIGFEYRDPEFWFFGTTVNYFSNAYIDISNLARTSNFNTDFDNQPMLDFDQETAIQLLKQEEIDPYMLVNLSGGKSWKVKSNYIGFFAVVSNILNENYKTGGFEQSRLAKYDRLIEDQGRENGPIFGNRYFFGYGTTYYLNFYLRF